MSPWYLEDSQYRNTIKYASIVLLRRKTLSRKEREDNNSDAEKNSLLLPE